MERAQLSAREWQQLMMQVSMRISTAAAVSNREVSALLAANGVSPIVAAKAGALAQAREMQHQMEMFAQLIDALSNQAFSGNPETFANQGLLAAYDEIERDLGPHPDDP